MEVTKFKEEYRNDIVKKVEIWVKMDHLGYSNYSISSFGKVMNIKTDRLLKITKNRIGYHKFHMAHDEGKKNDVSIHRMLALVFLVKPDEKKLSVDHIDRNIDNNSLHNLRWATGKEQNENRKKIERKSNPIIQYDQKRNIVRKWDSMQQILAANPLYKSGTIRASIDRKKKSAYTYIWEADKSDIENEVWLFHPIAINTEISDKGRVKTLQGFPTRGNMQDGYYMHKIGNKKHMVHDLVAAAFIDGFNKETDQVYHKNGNNEDNNLENIGLKPRKRKREEEEKEMKKKRKTVK